MQRVLVLGRGGSGKSTFSRRLAERVGLPVVELDSHFWQSDLEPLPRADWERTQGLLAAQPRWIMDGDLGPHDLLEPRLRAADTAFVFDFPLSRCAWRSLRRGGGRGHYWRWVITYRRDYLPRIMADLASVQDRLAVHVLRRPADVARALVVAESGAAAAQADR